MYNSSAIARVLPMSPLVTMPFPRFRGLLPLPVSSSCPPPVSSPAASLSICSAAAPAASPPASLSICSAAVHSLARPVRPFRAVFNRAAYPPFHLPFLSSLRCSFFLLLPSAAARLAAVPAVAAPAAPAMSTTAAAATIIPIAPSSSHTPAPPTSSRPAPVPLSAPPPPSLPPAPPLVPSPPVPLPLRPSPSLFLLRLRSVVIVS